MRRVLSILVAAAFLLSPATLLAQNRQDLQMQAELRQLTEQLGKLEVLVNKLSERLDAVESRADQTKEASARATANQQVSVDQVTTTLGTLRENTQETASRVSQLAEEVGAVRSGLRLLTDQLNAMATLLQSRVDAGVSDGVAPAGSGGVTLPTSPVQLFRSAQNDYDSGRYDLAIEGFQEYLVKFPTASDAHVAQLLIGQSYQSKKQCAQAIPAFQAVVDAYRSSQSVPDALVALGVCSVELNRRADAVAFYERVLREFPQSNQASIARQRLGTMRR